MAEDVSEMLRKQQEEVERIRARRQRGTGNLKQGLRMVLNVFFLVAAVAGFILYFQDEYHDMGLYVIIAGMALKVMEFLIRFLG